MPHDATISRSDVAVMAKIHATEVYKIFGAASRAVFDLAKSGLSPREVRERTGAVVAVNGVSLAVAPGDIFIVMGLSGSGKSTFVRCINRLIEPTAGAIEIDGENVMTATEARLRELRRGKVAMVFQNFALLPHRTVFDNVEYGLKIRGEAAPARREKARAVLELVGLLDWGDHYPEALSGGMKQRVGLARALANDPDVLLMDEPFSALDPLIRAELQDELLKLQSRIKKTIVFVTHDFHEALKLGDRIAIMKDGAFVQVGTPQEIVVAPADDYVRNFTREVDRGRVFSAGDVMRRHPDVEFDGRDLPKVPLAAPLTELYRLCASHAAIAVVDEKGQVVGTVGPREIFAYLAGAGAEGTR